MFVYMYTDPWKIQHNPVQMCGNYAYKTFRTAEQEYIGGLKMRLFKSM